MFKIWIAFIVGSTLGILAGALLEKKNTAFIAGLALGWILGTADFLLWFWYRFMP